MIRRPPRSTLFPLHDALPISDDAAKRIAQLRRLAEEEPGIPPSVFGMLAFAAANANEPAETAARRSEEHTSELQSQSNLVCRLLLEKKKRETDKAATSRMRGS